MKSQIFKSVILSGLLAFGVVGCTEHSKEIETQLSMARTVNDFSLENNKRYPSIGEFLNLRLLEQITAKDLLAQKGIISSATLVKKADGNINLEVHWLTTTGDENELELTLPNGDTFVIPITAMQSLSVDNSGKMEKTVQVSNMILLDSRLGDLPFWISDIKNAEISLMNKGEKVNNVIPVMVFNEKQHQWESDYPTPEQIDAWKQFCMEHKK